MTQKIVADRTGLPLIWIPSLNAFVNLFPVTKVSFEFFLCDRVVAQSFDASWYNKILQQNPREAVGEIRNENVEKAFITGVTPEEISKFCRWMGTNKYNCRIPTNEEWTEIYRYAASNAVLSLSTVLDSIAASARIEELIRNLLSASTQNPVPTSLFVGNPVRNTAPVATLASQMFLQNGIGEWVSAVNNNKACVGARGGIMRRLNGDGMDPVNSRLLFVDRADSRPKEVGFRLIIQERS